MNYLQEINLPEKALTMEWYKGTLTIGFKKEYVSMEVDTQESMPLFPLEKTTVPIVKLLSDDILLAKDGK